MVHGSWTAGDWRVRQAKVCVAGRGCTAGVCFFARPAVASPHLCSTLRLLCSPAVPWCVLHLAKHASERGGEVHRVRESPMRLAVIGRCRCR